MKGEMIERAKNILDHYAQKIAERKNAERAYRLDASPYFMRRVMRHRCFYRRARSSRWMNTEKRL